MTGTGEQTSQNMTLHPQRVVSVLPDICRQIYDTFMSVLCIYFSQFLDTLCQLISLAWLE
jgi:hypothetical protein